MATQEGYVAYVVNDNRVEKRAIRIGLRQVGKVEVREGLTSGERVVRSGHLWLSDGARVRIVQDDNDAQKNVSGKSRNGRRTD